MAPTPKVIDLYHSDGVSSFDKVYESGVRGVIHKATEGNTLTDSAYAHRRNDALDAGLLWGAYHFLRPGDYTGQARRFVDTAEPTESTLLAPDHEDRSVPLTGLAAFINEVLSETKRQRLTLYSGFLIKEQIQRAPAEIIAFLKSSTDLWLPQYGPAPKWPTNVWDRLFLWQFSETGAVPGVAGHVDVNSFDGTDEELVAQWVAA